MKPLIPNISSSLATTLSKKGKEHLFRDGEELFAEGDDALFLPIVISGKVKMIHFLDLGKEVIIGIFQAGEMFAVPPVFDGKKYPSTAIAMEESRILMLYRPEFLNLLRESSEFSFAILEWMSEMLRDKTATIHNLATTSPEVRIGHVLLKLISQNRTKGSVRIELRREDIARIAGLTTETTIRVIRRMAKKGLVEIDHGKILIEDDGPLRRLVEG
ncbi:MAG: Crp/Fnr family transcriptional regulator [Pyrinomonadaceae bacterium]